LWVRGGADAESDRIWETNKKRRLTKKKMAEGKKNKRAMKKVKI